MKNKSNHFDILTFPNRLVWPDSKEFKKKGKVRGSLFNELVTINGKTYCHNFLTRSSIKIISPFIRKLIESRLVQAALNKDFFTDQYLLNKFGFLVRDDQDEIFDFRQAYNNYLYSNDTLSLVVYPTYNCNFDCPYCFQEKKYGMFNYENYVNLIQFINKLSYNNKNIHIHWSGGEPLIAKSNIINVYKALKNLFKSHKVNLWMSLATNGYFLDTTFINKVEEINLQKILISIDGDKEDHNSTRFIKEGLGSFDKVYQNICMFAELKGDICDITLRINTSNDNYDNIPNLLHRFPLDIRNRISIYFSWVFKSENKHFKSFSDTKGNRPYERISPLYNLALELGYDTKNPLEDKLFGFCQSDATNHYVVDPRGNVFICSQTNKDNHKIGNINHPEYFSEFGIKYIQMWYAFDPFSDQECLKCKLLPTCMGGCRKIRATLGHRLCVEEKKSIQKFAKDIILRSIKKNNYNLL